MQLFYPILVTVEWEDKVKNSPLVLFTGLRQRMHKFSHVVKKDGGHVATCLLAFQRAKAEQYSTSFPHARLYARVLAHTYLRVHSFRIMHESSRICGCCYPRREIISAESSHLSTRDRKNIYWRHNVTLVQTNTIFCV